MERIWQSFNKWWVDRTFGQKFALIFLTLAFVAIMTYLFTISSQPEWEVMYDDLELSDSSAVANHLKDAGILFRISNGGKTILVPKDLVDQTRLDVAEADVIKQDDMTLGDLDKMPPVLSLDQQKLWRQRLIQGELAKTIKKIKGVKNAQISIAVPEKDIFDSSEDKPSASVMLILEPGIKISQEQVKAVKNLVAHSIPKLTSDGVFVTDQSGKPLSDEITDNSSTIDDLRTKRENSVAKKVKDVLNDLVGPENLTVAVTADMNFDVVQSKIDRVIPTTENSDGTATGTLISEQTAGEKYTGQDSKGQGGIPGTTSNITTPGYASVGPEGNTKSSDYNKNNITRNFEVSKEVKNITYAPGQLERLTVAVAVNKILTSQEQQTIEKLVQTAAGIDAARGDIVTVTGMAFSGAEEAEATQAKLEKENTLITYLSLVKDFLPYLLVTVFGGIFLIIFWTLLKRPVEVQEYEEVPEENEFDFPDTPELLEAASLPVIEAKLDPEVERMRSEINTFVMNDPAEAARLLLTYIKD